ncbi:hypothetical protein ADEAN_000132600 [Angomonas deanei]|uniref:Uncharacterized protein n=1 Tax=Angomonas deanei TaxID=59799 RepID=A0A7G2C555_9TRYP|nr:hypothetical protein ADEAN_000132600 [Angomonas deanei]
MPNVLLTKELSPPASASRPTTLLRTGGESASVRRESLSPAMSMSNLRRDSVIRAPSAKLNHAPVEQMSPIELRHEVRVLRQEVEQYQSSMLRLTTELENLKQKQKEERQRRQEARAARLQMLSRLQDAVEEKVAADQTEEEAAHA